MVQIDVIKCSMFIAVEINSVLPKRSTGHSIAENLQDSSLLGGNTVPTSLPLGKDVRTQNKTIYLKGFVFFGGSRYIQSFLLSHNPGSSEVDRCLSMYPFQMKKVAAEVSENVK